VNDLFEELKKDYGWNKGLYLGSMYKHSKDKTYLVLKAGRVSLILLKSKYEKGKGLVTESEHIAPLKDVTDEEFLFFKMNQDKGLTVISYSDMIDLIKQI
jgi:hypothetical protein